MGFGAEPRRENFSGRHLVACMPTTDRGEPAIVVGKAYDLVLWLLPKVEKFPRSYRFSVGDRLVSNSLDLLMVLVEAAYSSDKRTCLEQANLKSNTLRYLLRLAKELHLLSADSYEFAVGKTDEIGRMIGGWRKAKGGRP